MIFSVLWVVLIEAKETLKNVYSQKKKKKNVYSLVSDL